MLKIAVIRESDAISDADVQKMIPAFETQWNRDLAPIWHLEPARLVQVPADHPPPDQAWWVTFLDNSDQAAALAYHELTDAGLPLSKIFLETIQADGASVSVAATHEICEMAVDPTINLSAQDANGDFWALECGDPVEDEQYGYKIGDVLVTNFVTPAWFGYANSTGKLDLCGHVTSPFQVLSGGYAQRFGAEGWAQVNGDKVRQAHAESRRRKAPAGSRRHRRTIPLAQRRKSLLIAA